MSLLPEKSGEYYVYRSMFKQYVKLYAHKDNTAKVLKFKDSDLDNAIKSVIDNLGNQEIILDGQIVKLKRPIGLVRAMYLLRLNPDPKAKIKFYLLLANIFDRWVEEQYSPEKQQTIVLGQLIKLHKKFDKKTFNILCCASPVLDRDKNFEDFDEASQKYFQSIKTDIEPTDAIYLNFIRVLCVLHQDKYINLNYIQSYRAFNSPGKQVVRNSANKVSVFRSSITDKDYNPSHIDYSASVTLLKKSLDYFKKSTETQHSDLDAKRKSNLPKLRDKRDQNECTPQEPTATTPRLINKDSKGLFYYKGKLLTTKSTGKKLSKRRIAYKVLDCLCENSDYDGFCAYEDITNYLNKNGVKKSGDKGKAIKRIKNTIYNTLIEKYQLNQAPDGKTIFSIEAGEGVKFYNPPI